MVEKLEIISTHFPSFQKLEVKQLLGGIHLYQPFLVLMNQSFKHSYMKQKMKQKRLLKKEVFNELSSWDLGYSETLDSVHGIIGECGKEISEILSRYFISWDSLKSQRDDVIQNLENNYSDLKKNEIRKLVVSYIKEYWNSEDFKEVFGYSLSSMIDIEDLEY